jgi:hypothetical protein
VRERRCEHSEWIGKPPRAKADDDGSTGPTATLQEQVDSEDATDDDESSPRNTEDEPASQAVGKPTLATGPSQEDQGTEAGQQQGGQTERFENVDGDRWRHGLTVGRDRIMSVGWWMRLDGFSGQ